jgi:hypothetical protein
MSTQNYKNHRRLVPGYHFLLYLLLMGCLIGAGWIAYTAFTITMHGRVIAATLLGLALCALLLAWFTRSFALKAQDRAIRAEESLRYFALTGKLPDPRLTIGQIIALRFAGDTEYLILSERAAKESLKPDEIKKAIINWREDNYRV